MAFRAGLRPAEAWELTPGEISRYADAVGDEYERRAIHDALLNAFAFNDPKELGKMNRRRDAERALKRGAGPVPPGGLLDLLHAMGVTRPLTEEEKKA